jgi:hypothetical protein
VVGQAWQHTFGVGNKVGKVANSLPEFVWCFVYKGVRHTKTGL